MIIFKTRDWTGFWDDERDTVHFGLGSIELRRTIDRINKQTSTSYPDRLRKVAEDVARDLDGSADFSQYTPPTIRAGVIY